MYVPPDVMERDVILLLKPYGMVEKVVFDSDHFVEQVEDNDEYGEEDGDTSACKVATKKRLEPPPQVFPLPSQPLRTEPVR